MGNTKDFLGRGFAFPPRVDKATGRFVMCSDEEDIRQSIYIIIMTKLSERAMNPDFGSDVHRYIFELPDDAFLHLVKNEIVDALTRWEPRIIDTIVHADMTDITDGKVIFNISYTVRDTNNPYNLVFPYYVYEGIGAD